MRADTEAPVGGEDARLELTDGEGGAAEAAGREDGSHPRSVRQPRVEDRPVLGDIIAEHASDVLDGDHEVALIQMDPGHLLDDPLTLDEDATGSVDHNFADVGVVDQRGNGTKEREDDVEAHEGPQRAFAAR